MSSDRIRFNSFTVEGVSLTGVFVSVMIIRVENAKLRTMTAIVSSDAFGTFAIIPSRMLNDNLLFAGLASIILTVGLYLFFWFRDKKQLQSAVETPAPSTAPVPEPVRDREMVRLQLQAYERLILLTERIALHNIVHRIPGEGLPHREYAGLLIGQIRSEAEHNITQQVYVTDAAWDAVQRYREQNVFIIGNLSSALPAEADGRQLAGMILELMQTDPGASLYPVVLDALRYEARKLL